MSERRITIDTLKGWPGLARRTSTELVAAQPRTVLEALSIPGVGRKTTKRLLQLGLVIDPEGVQTRARTREELGLPPKGTRGPTPKTGPTSGPT
jgi:hypothetical protein